jgi:hypothetical protein
MPNRTETALAFIQALDAEVAQVLDRITEAQWQEPTQSEGWPVGFVARHIALGYGAATQWGEAGLSGQPLQIAPAAIDSANAVNVAKYGAGDASEVRALVAERQTALRTLVASATEADLDKPALVGARPWTVEQVVTALLARHTRSHLDSIRATVQATA